MVMNFFFIWYLPMSFHLWRDDIFIGFVSYLGSCIILESRIRIRPKKGPDPPPYFVLFSKMLNSFFQISFC